MNAKIFKNKKFIIAAIIIIIAGGYYWYSKSKSGSKAIQYVTEAAAKGTLTSSISASGNIIVDQQATVDPTISGTVANVAVKVGDSVKKGQLLFTIINDQLGTTASKSLASLISAQQSFESAQANKKQASYDLNHNTLGSQNKAILKEKNEASKISVSAAQQSLTAAQSAYRDASSDAAKRKVTAPIDGTVNAVNVKNGDDLSRLSSNSNSTAPIIIGDLKTLKAQVQVNEVDVTNISIGQKVTLKLDALDNYSATGKVTAVDALGTITQGVVTYNVTIDLDNQDARIKPQMSVSASIITNVKQDVLLVPSSAVKTQGNSSYVEVLNSGTTPAQKTVEVGASNTTDTEITSGINVGDKVVTQTINPNLTTSTSSTSSRIPGIGGFGR
ncbi:MAG: efflux RND transporter periplasmic adaptor subunit [Candidatus Moranbacteria bacterium]|nr:efflux RND transporter periplasmic adaptor subunit [Candidatus Moranbacteria bacterium]